MRRAGHLLFALVLALTPFSQAEGQTASEYAVKAAYLVKFVPFIGWPESVFAGPNSPITICLLGGDPFGSALDKAAAGGGGGRPIAIRRLATIDPVDGCHMLFVADPNVLVGELRDRPVVTVTDSNVDGGTIRFVVQDNHVRFDIDDSDAQAGGLRISSKLLELARKVIRRSGP